MARKCFEYRGYSLQALKGQACAVTRSDETGERSRIRLYDAARNPISIADEASARTALIAFADAVLKAQSGGDFSVSQIWQFFIEGKIADKKPTDSDENRWKALAPWFGHLRPHEVTDKICRDYATARFKPSVEQRRMRNGKYKEIAYPKGRAPDTVWSELITLQSALSWGLKKGHWTLGDGRSHKDFILWRPARSPPRDRVLTREESEALIECASGHTKLFVIIAMFTGARKGAILELTWDQVDLEAGIIDFRSRTALDPMSKHCKKGRATVHMSPTLRATMKVYAERSRSKYVIEYAGTNVDDIKGGWNKAAERAGLWSRTMDVKERVTPHVLRHTVATWLDDADVDERKIQSLLGHAPGTKITRQNYIKKRASATKDAVDVLDAKPRLRVVK